jgi:glycosidase
MTFTSSSTRMPPGRRGAQSRTGWFTDAMPDLNQENPLVSRYLIQNALWWVETANLDGIRLDTFPYVDRAFWHDFHATLHSVYPHLTTVGEIFNGDPEVTSFFAGGAEHRGIDTGLDTPFDFPVYFALRDVLIHGKPMTDLAKVLRQDALYPHPERLVSFIGNHDTTRFLTEAGGSVPRLKLALGLLQHCVECRKSTPETRSEWTAATTRTIVMTSPAVLQGMRTMPSPRPAAPRGTGHLCVDCRLACLAFSAS